MGRASGLSGPHIPTWGVGAEYSKVLLWSNILQDRSNSSTYLKGLFWGLKETVGKMQDKNDFIYNKKLGPFGIVSARKTFID